MVFIAHAYFVEDAMRLDGRRLCFQFFFLGRREWRWHGLIDGVQPLSFVDDLLPDFVDLRDDLDEQ